MDKDQGAAGALHLRGGARPKRVTGRRSDWTQAMGERFVETLADTCNVTLAAASIGRSIPNVDKWRAKNALFARRGTGR
jgi:hypothetical protein